MNTQSTEQTLKQRLTAHLPFPHAMTENLVYAVVWAMVFAGPVMNLYVHTLNSGQTPYPWDEVLHSWRYSVQFFMLFLVHNCLLAPQLIVHHRKKRYMAGTVALLVVFLVLQYVARPVFYDLPHIVPGIRRDEPLPSFIIDQMEIVNMVLAMLMMGMNLGTKVYYRNEADALKRQELEKQLLMQQRDHLRYQVNPHFFMNTLNNIHALVDINPDQAKYSIRELSRLMRYILYEGCNPSVPLQHEADFMNHYTDLMRMRYAGHVKISLDIPDVIPQHSIPPLVFIIFVENAFKHGISYQAESFIDIHLALGAETLTFSCTNSCHPRSTAEKGGMGLNNVRQRLQLIYGPRFTLRIGNDGKTFSVWLEMPYLS